MNQRPVNFYRSLNIQRGFTLVELMISLVLGLVVIGGVISVFLANQQSYRTNQALAEVQDSSRTAFEFLARDIRQAGGTPCGNASSRIVNTVIGGGAGLLDWSTAIHGYTASDATPVTLPTGNAAGSRAAGPHSDSLRLFLIDGTGISLDGSAKGGQSNSAQFKLSQSTTAINPGDIVLVCDPSQATIVQVTNYNTSNVTVGHNTGNSASPGNCTDQVGFPGPATCNTSTSPTAGTPYWYGTNSEIAALKSVYWYIGNNSVGGRSLYQVGLSGGATGTPQEMVRNVTGMDLMYHLAGGTGFVDTAGVGSNWDQVDAVQITLITQSSDQRAGTDIQPLTRSFTTTVTLRNRVN
jgi:type IV pilus assembly protein PilW